MKPRRTLARFDVFLAERKLALDAIVAGGAALGLLGIITAETRDCDVIHPQLPDNIRRAAAEFAATMRAADEPLADEWLNNGPSSLAQVLPAGWTDRLSSAFSGKALVLRSLGRPDLLLTKVFALCDRVIDLADCVALAPTPDELATIIPWFDQQDASPEWPNHVRAVIADLERRVSGGV